MEPIITSKSLPELSADELETVNFHRRKEFNIQTPWTSETVSKLGNCQFVLLKDQSGALLAFGGIWQLHVTFMGTQCNILGVVSVISIIKKKGYGLLVQKELQRIAKSRGLTMIGFCQHKNGEFYKKCGYNVYPWGNHRFVHYKAEDELVLDPKLADVFYLDGADRLMEKVKANPEEFVFHYVSHW